ncbi:bile acid:sodium symporter [Natronococcus sp. A-GB7]|uniref:bile acid:sodium symporter family protein n=1 Tax=Natronococcus sp. A-GB7 TaxID=3037649 RepID=UPI00241FF3A6|nr:bile acid:sodium symporter [Natronococcus sp. A-GB7]MDG5818136.1 sodium symporter [Natronococcus sp. A-GB7]
MSVETVVEVATTIFVLSTMFSIGMELSLGQLLAALRRRRLMTKSLVVNLVAVPVLAYLLVRPLPVEAGYAAGIVLIAVAPGAPFGPKFAELSNSNIEFASGLMAVLGIISVVTIPASLALLLPGNVAVDPLAIGWMVFGIQLLPLLAGMGLDLRFPSATNRLYPPVQRLSDLSFLLLIVLLLAAYSNEMLALVGTGTLFISAVVIAASLVLGYALGGPGRNTREVLATTTAARNAAIALFIATTSFSDPDVLMVVLAFSFVGVVLSGLLAGAWRRLAT